MEKEVTPFTLEIRRLVRALRYHIAVMEIEISRSFPGIEVNLSARNVILNAKPAPGEFNGGPLLLEIDGKKYVITPTGLVEHENGVLFPQIIINFITATADKQ